MKAGIERTTLRTLNVGESSIIECKPMERAGVVKRVHKALQNMIELEPDARNKHFQWYINPKGVLIERLPDAERETPVWALKEDQ